MKRNMSSFFCEMSLSPEIFKTWPYYCLPSSEVERKFEFSRPFAINLRDLYSFFRLRRTSGQPVRMPIVLLSSNFLPGEQT